MGKESPLVCNVSLFCNNALYFLNYCPEALAG